MDTNELATEILARNCKSYCNNNKDFEYVDMKFIDCTNYVAKEEDIPSLVESIKFWSEAKPKKDKKFWTKLDYEIESERMKKELILIQMLGSFPNWFDTRLRREIKKEVKNAQNRQRASPCHK